MQLRNATSLAAGYSVATDKAGREWLVVVAKATYGIPDAPDRDPPLLEQQVPLVMADVFTGEPACSATLYENDFAPRKPRVDVLLNGSAYAPGGEPVARLTVALRVGDWSKSFDVVGHRTWRAGVLFASAGPPEPFTVLPISYDNAYGGVDRSAGDPAGHTWYPGNHAGVGYRPNRDARTFEGAPLPNTEETGRAVTSPRGQYRPMAFGPLGRGWPERVRWAGTYDQKWLDDCFPFLPEDFDERYFQGAPEDQQLDSLEGGEEVVLSNLTPRGRTAFRLPAVREPFEVLYKSGESTRVEGVVDTLVLEPDLGRFTLSLRGSLALRRNIHEVRRVTVGRVLRRPAVPAGGERPVAAKPHYRSLAEMIAAKTARGERP